MTNSLRYVGAALAGVVSLLGSVYSLGLQIGDIQLLTGATAQQMVPLPSGLLPPGTLPPKAPLLTEAQRDALTATLVRQPLDQQRFNLLCVDELRASPAKDTAADTALLARLGWRSSIAQINLMVQAGLHQHYGVVVDRADALLRRQKFTAVAVSLLASMESMPEVHGLVVKKLEEGPDWKSLYLSAIQPNASKAILGPRIQTIRALLNSPVAVSRSEIVPTLTALLVNRRSRDAYDLWRRWAGLRQSDDLVADSSFKHAAAALDSADAALPFEWQFKQDLGYAATPTDMGVAINWDGRGVPVFMAQLLPVETGGRYLLTIEGDADHDSIGTLLTPTLSCGQQTVAFTAVGNASGRAQYRSDPVPNSCDLATLSINGRVDVSSGEADITLHGITLTRIS